MNKVLSKLRVYAAALIRIIAHSWQSLTDEFNFDPTLAVGIQVALTATGGGAITVQPEVTQTRRP
jgi:hypothetical protein